MRVSEDGLRVESRVGDGVRIHILSLGEDGELDALASARSLIDRYRLLEHPALPPVLEVEDGEDRLVVVTPRDEGVRLDRLRKLLANDQTELPDPAVWLVGWRLFGALAAAHLARDASGLLLPLIHGSLSMSSMVVTHDGELRVHGFCPHLDPTLDGDEEDDTRGRSQSIVPQAWWAPEVRQGNTAHPPSDVYSAALILRTLLAGLPQPIPGSSILPLAEARPDLPRDITEALDRAVMLRDETPPTAADLSLRFEGLVRVSDGKKALRELIELQLALSGLFSVATPQPWQDDEPLSERVAKAPDEPLLEALPFERDDASPESLRILDEASTEIAREMDSLLIELDAGAFEDEGGRLLESIPVPLEVRAPREPVRRRPTPPPLPVAELVRGDDVTPGKDEVPVDDVGSEADHVPDEDEANDQARVTIAATPFLDPPSDEPDLCEDGATDAGDEEDGHEQEDDADEEPDSSAIDAGYVVKEQEAPANLGRDDVEERARRDSAAPIELSRIAEPVLGDEDELGELDPTLDDTQPDLERPSNADPPSPFLMPNDVLRRAKTELESQHENGTPRVLVEGHFEVAGDPAEDEIGDEVVRVAPRKKQQRTLAEARARRARPESEPPPPPLSPSFSDPPLPSSSRPTSTEPEGGSSTRWGVFLAVAAVTALATWYGSEPPAKSPPPLTSEAVRSPPPPSPPPAPEPSHATRPAATPHTPELEPPEPIASATLETPEEELMTYEGYLIIESSADAIVVLKGKPVGATNEKNRVRCGKFKHVRLRHKLPPAHGSPWLTIGESIAVPCQKTSTHEIEPDVLE